MGQRVAGTCWVKAAGRQLEITGNVECPLSDKERESIKPGFYSETDRVPYIQVDALMTRDFPIRDLVEDTDQTVTAELKSGRVYVLSGAYLVGDTAVTGDDGTAALRWEGTRGTWQ